MRFAHRSASARPLVRALLTLVLALPLATAARADAPAAPDSVTPADTLFARVIAQQAARFERIAHMGGGALKSDDVLALLQSGRVDEAAAALPRPSACCATPTCSRSTTRTRSTG